MLPSSAQAHVEPGWMKIGTLPLPSPSTREGRCFRLDFFEEIRPEDVKVLVVGVRIE
jgi:hypothetical protein